MLHPTVGQGSGVEDKETLGFGVWGDRVWVQDEGRVGIGYRVRFGWVSC